MHGRLRSRRTTVAAAFAGVLALLLAATAVALPPGTHRPGQAEASQIVKYTGDTTNCLNIVVDTRSPKWALVQWRGGQGCPTSASFAGFAIAYERAPQNEGTAGFAWSQVLETAHPSLSAGQGAGERGPDLRDLRRRLEDRARAGPLSAAVIPGRR
ncbi:MAG TPA: hypothetical protein VHX88_17200 [Solirubrobacteraceae bacterium]|jgi:hypothetical protein|nr:hypothetical protein [Solirubrobacteraceae bacterium]